MRKKQDLIVRKASKSGLAGLSRRDALFMYVSQWVEWYVLTYEEVHLKSDIEELMQHWLIVYHTIRTQHIN